MEKRTIIKCECKKEFGVKPHLKYIRCFKCGRMYKQENGKFTPVSIKRSLKHLETKQEVIKHTLKCPVCNNPIPISYHTKERKCFKCNTWLEKLYGKWIKWTTVPRGTPTIADYMKHKS